MTHDLINRATIDDIRSWIDIFNNYYSDELVCTADRVCMIYNLTYCDGVCGACEFTESCSTCYQIVGYCA